MKYLLTILLFFTFISYSYAQDWAEVYEPTFPNSETGFSDSDAASSVSKDRQGNMYYTGSFQGKIKFGTYELTSAGSNDVFVAKINSSGEWQWAISAGGSSSEYGLSIAVDVNGNSYVSGYYLGQPTFGSTTLPISGATDAFIAKVSPTGNWLWARSVNSVAADRANSVAVDSIGNVYITGTYTFQATFGETLLSSAGNKDIFVAKLNSAGNWQWAKSAGSSAAEDSWAIEFDRFGACIIGGSIRNDATFGDILVGHNSQRDIFIAKIDLNGNWQWAKSYGSNSNDDLLDLAVTYNGDYYATGYYNNTVNFDGTLITSQDDEDIWVGKFNSTGTVQWIASAGNSGNQRASSVIVDQNNDIVVGGTLFETSTFGNITFNSMGSRDIFIAKLNDTGTWIDAERIGLAATEDLFDLEVDFNNNYYFAGSFFEFTQIDDNEFESNGSSDILVGSRTDDGSWRWSQSLGGLIKNVTINDMVYDSDGNKYVIGTFSGEVAFDGLLIESEGLSDFYVAKLNKNNKWEWAVSGGGSADDIGKSIAIDSEGNLAISGVFYGTFSLAGENLLMKGNYDFFTAMLDNDGNWLWATSVGTSDFEEPYDLICDSNDDFIITGYYSRSIKFGSLSSMSNSGDFDIFVAKFDGNGDWIWSQKAGGGGFDEAFAITTDDNDNIYVGGYFEGNASFGSINLSSFGSDDIVVAKMNSAGQWQWANKAGSSAFRESATDVMYHDGYLYATGYYKNNSTFGDRILISRGDVDLFLSKFDLDGNWVWTKDFGGSLFDEGSKLGYNPNTDEILLSGIFEETINFSLTSLTSSGKRDLFYATFDTDGNINSVRSWGGAENDEVTGMFYSEYDENVYFSGNYLNQIDFDDIAISQEFSFDMSCYVAVLGEIFIPEGFAHKATGKRATITVPEAILPGITEDRLLVAGDYVGVFYEEGEDLINVGYGIWDGTDLSFTVYGDDELTAEKDGLDDDEKYNFYVWDSLLDEIFPVTVGYASGPNKFQENAVSVLQSMPFKLIGDQTVNLAKGWNYVSLFVYPKDRLVEDMFADIDSDMLLAKSKLGTYFPAFNLNTMVNWDYTSVHKIFMRNANSFSITDSQILPEEEPIDVIVGWNDVPYYKDSDLSPDEAFADLGSDFVMLRDFSTGMYIPSLNYNTIGDVKVGTGYRLYSSANTSFTYPGIDILSKTAPRTPNRRFINDQFNTGSYSNILIKSPLFAKNGVVHVLNSLGEINGGAYTVDGFAAIELRGDCEDTPEIEGFKAGDELRLVYFDNHGNKYSLEVENIKDLSGNSYSKLEFVEGKVLEAELKQINENQKYFASPNPAKEFTELTIYSDKEQEAEITLFNMLGEKIKASQKVLLNGRYNNILYDLNDISNGSYYFLVETNEGVFSISIIVMR